MLTSREAANLLADHFARRQPLSRRAALEVIFALGRYCPRARVGSLHIASRREWIETIRLQPKSVVERALTQVWKGGIWKLADSRKRPRPLALNDWPREVPVHTPAPATKPSSDARAAAPREAVTKQPTPIWSRTPSPEQRAACERACARFLANMRNFWNGEALPEITWRWLLPEDGDPSVDAKCWGSMRVEGHDRVTISLRADASAKRTFHTVIHELAHAVDHHLVLYGMPREMAEQRADHIEYVLGED